METIIKLGVYRRLDNRMQGLDDNSPMALELHNRRKAALHDVFDSEENITVKDWGGTNDENSHEFVEITIAAFANVAFKYAIVPGLKYVGEKLAEKLVDEGTSKAVQWIISKLRPKQDKKEIQDFQISIPGGGFITVDPPDGNAEIRISFADGSVSEVNYKKL